MKGKRNRKNPTGKPMPVVLSTRGLRPPSVDISPSVGYTFRYVYTGGGGNFQITRADLLSRLAMAASANSAFRLFAGVKLRALDIWGASALADASITLQWKSEYGPTKVLNDASSSTAYIPHISSKPPKESLAAAWSTVGSNESTVLFSLNLTSDSIVDVHITAVFGNAFVGETAGTTIAIAAGTAGNIGMPALDHSGSAALIAFGWNSYA
jgi:hypothetical protein